MRRLISSTAFVLFGSSSPAWAQTRSPFGVGISEGGGGTAGFTGWLLAQQGWFEHQLSAAVRSAKVDPGALWVLVGIGFLYGVLHAAGPGHGKAVLASYVVANDRAYRRGLLLSGLAALLQGMVAIALVGTLALVFQATAQHMRNAASAVETLSFAGIVCLGLWLTWRKGRAFATLVGWRPVPGAASAGAPFPVFRQADFAVPASRFSGLGAATAPSPRFVCVDADALHETGSCSCHGVDPSRLGAPRLSWREASVTVLAAGSRPCSGAILVLVFALAQGFFLAGMAAVLAMSVGVALTTAALACAAAAAKHLATRLAAPGSGTGRLIAAGVELAAAVTVLLAGLALLIGSAQIA